jgi:hypothetical protein
LADNDGQLLVEVVDDHVSAHTLGASTSGMSWREVEVELGGHGDRELLDQVERRLLDAACAVRTRGRSWRACSVTVARAGARGAAGSQGPGRRGGAGVPAGQADAIVWGDPAVRQDLPGAVHQMRVATRRMRSALQAYGRVVERSATRELANELKWLAGVLGAARDLEVLHARFTQAVEQLPDELVLGPVQARLTRFFAGRETEPAPP